MDRRQHPGHRSHEEDQRLRGRTLVRRGAIDMIRIDGLPAPYLKRLTPRGQRRSRALDDARGRGNAVRSAGRAAPAEHARLHARTVSIPSRHVERCEQRPRAAIPSAVAARRVSTAPPPPAATLMASIERRPSEPGISRYRVRLPGTRLPIVALDLDVGLRSPAATSTAGRSSANPASRGSKPRPSSSDERCCRASSGTA